MSQITPREIVLKTGEPCVVRTAEPRDAAGLLAVTMATLRGPDSHVNVTLPEEFTFTEEQEVAWIEQHRDEPGWLALVAEVDGRVAGTINFKNGLRRRIAHQGAFGMNVHPDWRGRGMGDALLGALLDWARASPLIEKVCLGMVARNAPAEALYRKHGFREEGRHLRAFKHPDGSYDDDVAMFLFV